MAKLGFYIGELVNYLITYSISLIQKLVVWTAILNLKTVMNSVIYKWPKNYSQN